jgi:hydroxymethylpyrimidine kinase/phosphomethylpyrimidine kinase
MTVTSERSDRPTVLTIAGFDPSGGAGIIADIRTFVHFGCRPTAAISSLTFQNSQGVFGAVHESAGALRAQILPIVAEHKVAAVKIGMLPTAELVSEVVALIDEKHLPAPVLDPVMRSSSGHRLIEEGAMEILIRELLPRTVLITPNIPEAESLTGIRIEDELTMRKAAQQLREIGARTVLIKGGHLRQETGARRQESGQNVSEAIDLLDDEGEVTIFRGEWIDAQPVRGTGCMLSAGIAASLAGGSNLKDAIAAAKQFVAAEIQNSELRTPNSEPRTQN